MGFKSGATIISEVEAVFTSLVTKLEKGIGLEQKAKDNKQTRVDKINFEMREHEANITKANKIKSRIEAITE